MMKANWSKTFLRYRFSLFNKILAVVFVFKFQKKKQEISILFCNLHISNLFQGKLNGSKMSATCSNQKYT